MVYCDRVILLMQVLERRWLVILLLRLQLWNIQNNGQYANCDSMKDFIIILFLSTYMKEARRTRALSFWHAFLQRLLTCSSNFKSLSIVIPRSTSFIFDSMEESSISAVDGSLQLKRIWLLSMLAFIKLLLNHGKSGSDDASNVLITDFLFSLTVYIVLSA